MSRSRNARHVAGLAGVAHGVRNLHEFAPQLLGRVDRCQLGGHGFDGGAQLGERAQLGAASLAGQPPADDKRIERVPAVGRQDPDPHPLGGFDQAQGLQDADGLADHGAGDLEFIFELLGQHDMTRREFTCDDAGAQMFDGTVVEAGRHSRKHNAAHAPSRRAIVVSGGRSARKS